MAYSDIAELSSDNDFIRRSTACAATEGESNPPLWASDNQWRMAATPGFGDKYASAVAGGVPRPGNDQSVISDGDILSAVQSIMNAPPE